MVTTVIFTVMVNCAVPMTKSILKSMFDNDGHHHRHDNDHDHERDHWDYAGGGNNDVYVKFCLLVNDDCNGNDCQLKRKFW